MRKNILSMMIASFVALVVLGMSNLVRDDARGVAVAATHTDVDQGEQGSRKGLRKSVAYQPSNFLQLKGRDVRSLLKEPDLVRQDFPTVIWQYRTRSCVLDIYFSSQSDDVSRASVVHYEVRAREAGGRSEADVSPVCVRHLVRARNGLRMVDVSAIYKKP